MNKHARLTPEATRGWDETLRRRHVKFTPLMEIIGLRLAAGDDSWIPADVWAAAQQLDFDRGSRRLPPAG